MLGNHSKGHLKDIYHLPILFKVLDSFLIYISLFILHLFIGNVQWIPQYNLLALITVLIFIFSAEIVSLYQSWRGVAFKTLIQRLLLVWIVTILCLVMLGFFTKQSADYSRLLTSTWLIVAPVTLVLWRTVFRLVLNYFRSKGYNSRTVAFVGVNDLSEKISKHVRATSSLGMIVEGFYDDRGVNRKDISQGKITGNSSLLIEKIKRGEIDLVYITLPMRADERIKELIDKLSDTTTSVYLLPDLYIYKLFNGTWSNLAGHPVVSVFEQPFEGMDAFLKRLQDIVFSTIILTLISPILLAISIAVKMTSAGPVLFKQRRYGVAGENIEVWKFRSMTSQDNGDEIQQATKGDTRITPLGGFLRRTSLDELPQFINVLMGDMSIVGPRPHAAAHNELYRKKIRGYMLRHAVKPGITGWAQINGWRGETDTLDKMEGRIEHDHWYISNWSIWLDIKIIFMTVFKGFISRNAY